MSITLIVWLFLFAGLVLASFQKSVYAISLYMLTFFLLPQFWWWGDALASFRWNLYGGIILLLFGCLADPPVMDRKIRQLMNVSLLILANMTLVNFILAGNSHDSFDAFQLLFKFLVLTYLMFRTISTVDDLKIALISILLGGAYIGFECMVNDRGDVVNNRLEGVGAPGATTANHFASLMVTIVPLVAPFFLRGRFWLKALMLPVGGFIANVVLLCNSRGAFLSAIVSAVVFVFMAPKEIRFKSLKLIALGAFGIFLLLGDGRIFDRFLTTFASTQERDRSAQSRLDFWAAGASMIADYPLGAGGNGFKKVHGVKYLRSAGVSNVARAIHNGYLNEICQWGFQGLALRVVWYYLAIALTVGSIRQQIMADQQDDFLIIAQIALLAGTSAFLLGSMFGDLLDAEWGHWMVALMASASAISNKLIGEDRYEEHEELDVFVESTESFNEQLI